MSEDDPNGVVVPDTHEPFSFPGLEVSDSSRRLSEEMFQEFVDQYRSYSWRDLHIGPGLRTPAIQNPSPSEFFRVSGQPTIYNPSADTRIRWSSTTGTHFSQEYPDSREEVMSPTVVENTGQDTRSINTASIEELRQAFQQIEASGLDVYDASIEDLISHVSVDNDNASSKYDMLTTEDYVMLQDYYRDKFDVTVINNINNRNYNIVISKRNLDADEEKYYNAMLEELAVFDCVDDHIIFYDDSCSLDFSENFSRMLDINGAKCPVFAKNIIVAYFSTPGNTYPTVSVNHASTSLSHYEIPRTITSYDNIAVYTKIYNSMSSLGDRIFDSNPVRQYYSATYTSTPCLNNFIINPIKLFYSNQPNTLIGSRYQSNIDDNTRFNIRILLGNKPGSDDNSLVNVIKAKLLNIRSRVQQVNDSISMANNNINTHVDSILTQSQLVREYKNDLSLLKQNPFPTIYSGLDEVINVEESIGGIPHVKILSFELNGLHPVIMFKTSAFNRKLPEDNVYAEDYDVDGYFVPPICWELDMSAPYIQDALNPTNARQLHREYSTEYIHPHISYDGDGVCWGEGALSFLAPALGSGDYETIIRTVIGWITQANFNDAYGRLPSLIPFKDDIREGWIDEQE